jgi:hypothetical protein
VKWRRGALVENDQNAVEVADEVGAAIVGEDGEEREISSSDFSRAMIVLSRHENLEKAIFRDTKMQNRFQYWKVDLPPCVNFEFARGTIGGFSHRGYLLFFE